MQNYRKSYQNNYLKIVQCDSDQFSLSFEPQVTSTFNQNTSADPTLDIGRFGGGGKSQTLAPPRSRPEESHHFRPASPSGFLDIPGGSDVLSRSRSASASSREAAESDVEQEEGRKKKKKMINFEASGLF